MTEQFKAFTRTLKNMGIFGNYILACQKYNGCRNVDKIKYTCCSMKEMLNMSFNWGSSKEGSDFWFGVYNKL